MNDIVIKRPWDRRDNESDQAFEAFQLFLKLEKRGDPERTKDGPRRFVTDLAKQLKKRNQTLNVWFSKHEWEARAAAYDAFMCPIVPAEDDKDDDRELAKDLRAIAGKLRKKAIEALDTIIITNAEDAVRVMKLANECDEKARKIDKPEAENRKAQLVDQITGLLKSITSGVGGMAGGGAAGSLIATERTIRFDSAGNGREIEPVCGVSELPGEVCEGDPGSELVG